VGIIIAMLVYGHFKSERTHETSQRTAETQKVDEVLQTNGMSRVDPATTRQLQHACNLEVTKSVANLDNTGRGGNAVWISSKSFYSVHSDYSKEGENYGCAVMPDYRIVGVWAVNPQTHQGRPVIQYTQ
jgi:hypothetical protein